MAPYNVMKARFADIYALYVRKAERKGRSPDEVNRIICWLSGYSPGELSQLKDSDAILEDFLSRFPSLNENSHKITGMVCGVRVEDIEDPLARRMRYLDKLVDELARGRSMDSILRKGYS